MSDFEGNCDDEGDGFQRESIGEDDYYAFLNLPRSASTSEINSAFRRASRLYHPDKHPDDKVKAEEMFTRAKRAHEVLSDERRRAIYDTLGVKGLETDGWEVVQRTKTPAEIREEYEQLAQEREERRLQQRTNPQGTFVVGVDATDVFERYVPDDEEEYEHSRLPNLEINQMALTQSIDAMLTSKDTVTVQGSLSVHNGTGNGSFSAVFRRILSARSWGEVGASAGSGPGLHCKAYTTFANKMFATMSGSMQFAAAGVRPAATAIVGRHLDTHTLGYIAWRAGSPASLTTCLVWDTSTHHAAVSLCFGVPTSYAMLAYTRRFEAADAKLRLAAKVGTFGALLEYGAERKLTAHSSLGATMSVGVPSGVTLKVKLHRASQTYVFPIHLAESVVPAAVLYGTVAPLVAYYAARALLYHPWLLRQRRRHAEETREKHATTLAQRRREAEAAVALMAATVARVLELETQRHGLVIMQAWYGLLVTETSRQAAGKVIDVTVPLQCQVKDSKLVLHEGTKAGLPGFYDPAPTEEKSLHVLYRFHDVVHEVTMPDAEPLRIPKQSHRIQTQE
ncbi:PREDICTED: dnaJ homolog subfamily C member 11-like [Priapulus caudatus]|uniref:DnaJ homolog subfamily C member 11-like n=1 Tax=Priapulus caudatus TaxID=37621 RepID=A0ABM1F0F6_PRICU|nr:PREDICTED: dnaJ homolog subfamily C member 11-like [Priapulus caudatus]